MRKHLIDISVMMKIAKRYCVILSCLLLLLSCSSNKKVVKETVENNVHVTCDSTSTNVSKVDSTSISHSTTVEIKEQNDNNTVITKHDSTVIIVDTSGNIIKKETWHKEKETTTNVRNVNTSRNDSSSEIRHLKTDINSLQARFDSLRYGRTETVEKVRYKQNLGQWLLNNISKVVIGMLILNLFISFIKRTWQNKTL